MDRIKRLLALESEFRIDHVLFDRLLEKRRVLHLKKYEPLIDAGEYRPDVYIVSNGIIRGTYIQKNVEVTTGFALPGTLLFSFHCYCGNVPSFLRFEACCHSEVIQIPRNHFDSLIEESHDFARWVMNANQNQLYYNEHRFHLLSGDARSCLLQLVNRWSDMAPDAPREYIVQSLGVSDNHRIRMKRELTDRWKNILPMVPSKIIASYLGITEQHLSKIKREILMEMRGM